MSKYFPNVRHGRKVKTNYSKKGLLLRDIIGKQSRYCRN